MAKERSVEQLLDDAETALSDGDAKGALEHARKAKAKEPDALDPRLIEAEALHLLGEWEEAEGVLREALKHHGAEPDLQLMLCDVLLSRGEEEQEVPDEVLERLGRLRVRPDAAEAPWRPSLLALEGEVAALLGDFNAAVEAARERLTLLPEDVDTRVRLAELYFEACRFPEAIKEAEAVAKDADDDARIHHLLGLIAERGPDRAASARHFQRARELAPEDFPEPVTMSHEEFEKAIEEALESLPEKVRAYLSNVPIVAEEVPSDADLTGNDPPLSPQSLGMFRGAPWKDKGVMDPWAHLPSSISLYQNNLQRYSQNRAELLEEIEITLLHEVGHFLGLDDDELGERGLA